MSAPLEHTLIAVTFEHCMPVERFDKVPPHITVLPWFDARGRVGLIDEVLEDTEPFSIRQGSPMIVGAPGHEKSAVSIDSPELVGLHQKLFRQLVDSGVEFTHPEWLGENYRPHYRQNKGADPFKDTNEIAVNEIAVVDNIAVSGVSKGHKIISYLRLGHA